jgi:predicted transcriptional regulator
MMLQEDSLKLVAKNLILSLGRHTLMKVLLSIKPEFAYKILNGEKKYEFRRSIFKRAEIKDVIIYASAPISKIIGEFEIDRIVYEDIEKLWDITNSAAGISKEYFLKYFNDKEKGYAIRVKKSKKYEKPLCLKSTYGLLPPQSFLYLD